MCCFRLSVPILLYQTDAVFVSKMSVFVFTILVIKKQGKYRNVVSLLQDGVDLVDWEPRNKEFRIQLKEAISETNGISTKEWELHWTTLTKTTEETKVTHLSHA